MACLCNKYNSNNNNNSNINDHNHNKDICRIEGVAGSQAAQKVFPQVAQHFFQKGLRAWSSSFKVSVCYPYASKDLRVRALDLRVRALDPLRTLRIRSWKHRVMLERNVFNGA